MTTVEPYRRLPFELVVEELDPERDLSRSPLFQVSFAYDPRPRVERVAAGLRLLPEDLELGSGRFDLALRVRPTVHGDGLQSRDFTFVSNLWTLPNFLVGNLGVPANTVPELIELLRANPKKYFFGHSGAGTTPHLSGEMFKLLAGGLDIVSVPYKGAGPSFADLLSG
jgi:hypothetical protein